MFEFFVITNPGFEEATAREIRAWWPEAPQCEVSRGGITLKTDDLASALELNRCLKTPNRILVRVLDFGCRDFPKLFKKLSNFKWDDWIPDNSKVEFHVSSQASRLSIKRRIEETCLDGRKKYLKAKGAPAPSADAPVFGVWVRIDEDVCFVSLDASGEILHKRGSRAHVSEAPLRESTAAALLWSMLKEGDQDLEVFDPMMGGGTFLLEALTLSRKETREFAFQKFTKEISQENAVKTELPQFFVRGAGVEADPKTIEAARVNLRGLTEKIRIIEGDLFNAAPIEGRGAKPLYLICNPPYGERIKIEERFSTYYPKVFEACEKIAKPDRALFIIPEKARPLTLKHPDQWKRVGDVKFSNGGISVQALIFERIHK